MNNDEHFRWLVSHDPSTGHLPKGWSTLTALHVLAERIYALEEDEVFESACEEPKPVVDGVNLIRACGYPKRQPEQLAFNARQVRDLLTDAMASAATIGPAGVGQHHKMIDALLAFAPDRTFKPIEDDPFALEDDCDTDD